MLSLQDTLTPFVGIVYKRMSRYLLLFLFGCSLLVTSCGEDTPEDTPQPTRDAEGHVSYGGTFKMAIDEKYQTLFPSDILDHGSSNLANQIYESLLGFDPSTMKVVPALAESYDIDDSNTVYTFKLKQGVYFHDDPCFEGGKGREVKASDVKFSFELICSGKVEMSVYANTFQNRLVGSQAYTDGEASEVTGIEVIDDYTIKLTLEAPRQSFLYVLAMPNTSIIPKEAYEKYGKEARVGTGPFRYIAEGDTEEKTILLRNDNYHVKDSFGNQLPYLDTFSIAYINSKNTQLEEFRNGNLDIINGLPSEKVKEVVREQIADFSNVPPKYILGRSPEMITQFYEFNLSKEVFKDVKVRKAFNYAINRQKIYHDILSEEAFGPGNHGLSPPSFPGYDIEKINGYSYDPEMARQLLAQAGYPGGKGFPDITIELNSGGTRNSRVAFEIQKQLSEVLNINVDIDVVSFAQKIEDARNGRSEIFRAAWVADYPTPETFLWICYGKTVPEDLTAPSYPNTMRYKNPEFDALFEKGVSAATREEAYEYFMQAEQIMINDAPMIVLWYSENYRLLQSYVRNYYSNPMSYLDCSTIYMKSRDEVQTEH